MWSYLYEPVHKSHSPARALPGLADSRPLPQPGIGPDRTCPCGGGCPRCDEPDSESQARFDRSLSPAAAGADRLGNGDPLPAGLQEKLSRGTGCDLSSIRIHTDTRAAASAESVRARAYAYGNDIVFNAREYQPDSPEGVRLIAHEARHCLENQGGMRSIRRQTPPGQETKPAIVINYDLFCDQYGRVPDEKLLVAQTMLFTPSLLEQIYLDGQAGNRRAWLFFENMRLTWGELGKTMADKLGPFSSCTLAGWGCPSWDWLTPFSPDTVSGRLFRQTALQNFVARAQAKQVNAQIIANMLMLIPAAGALERAVLREAALASEAEVASAGRVMAAETVVPLPPRPAAVPAPAPPAAGARATASAQGPYYDQAAVKLDPLEAPAVRPVAVPEPQPAKVIPFPAAQPALAPQPAPAPAPAVSSLPGAAAAAAAGKAAATAPQPTAEPGSKARRTGCGPLPITWPHELPKPPSRFLMRTPSAECDQYGTCREGSYQRMLQRAIQEALWEGRRLPCEFLGQPHFCPELLTSENWESVEPEVFESAPYGYEDYSPEHYHEDTFPEREPQSVPADPAEAVPYAAHHIWPLYLGGMDYPDNLCTLEAQDHMRGHAKLDSQVQWLDYYRQCGILSPNLKFHPAETEYYIENY